MAAGAGEDEILTGKGLGRAGSASHDRGRQPTRQVPRLRAALVGRRLELVICTQETAKGVT